jgi:hypothetical protein
MLVAVLLHLFNLTISSKENPLPVPCPVWLEGDSCIAGDLLFSVRGQITVAVSTEYATSNAVSKHIDRSPYPVPAGGTRASTQQPTTVAMVTYKNQSTTRIIPMLDVGSPTLVSTITMVTSPA